MSARLMKGGMIFQHECEHGDFLGSICLVEMFKNLSLFFVFMSLCHIAERKAISQVVSRSYISSLIGLE